MKNVNFFNFGAKGTANSGGGNSRLFFKAALLLLTLTLGFGQMWGTDPDVDFTMSTSTKGDYFKNYTVGTNTVTISTSASSISSGNGGYYIDLGSNSSVFSTNYLGVKVTGGATISKVEILASGSGNNKSVTAPVVGWEEGWDGSGTTADAGLTLSYTTPGSNGSKFSTAEWREANVASWGATEVRIYKKLSSVTVTGYTLPTTAETVRIWGVRVYLSEGLDPSATPSITVQPSTSSAQYFTGDAAAALSVTATSSAGTLSYQWYSNTTASTSSGTILTNCTTATYTPSTSAEGTLYYYCAVTNTETSKSPKTVKSNVSGAISVIAAPTHLVENRLNVTSGDWSSNNYTNDPTNITSLTAWQIAAGQDRTAGVTDKQSIKNGRTHAIGTTSSKTDGYYMYLSFTIASGKRLKLSAVNIPVFGISAGKTTEVEIEDANSTKISVTGAITQDADGNGFGTYDFSEAPYLQGAVTLKMWAYGATSGYRMKSPIYLDGAISDIPSATAPTITAPATDQTAEYSINDVITPLSITATGYPAPTYQWYKNGSASTDGATSISGAESANYTPANSAASDFYYYCVATNASGSATSHYFHVTVLSCTPPSAPASLEATKTHTTANLSWDPLGTGANGYKIALVSASGEGTFDWKDEAANAYEATGLTPETEYTFKIKYKGGAGQCEFSEEVTVDFTTNAIPTYDVTFNMNGHGASIAKQTITEGGKATAPYVADVDSWVFGGWFTDAECTAGNEFDFANTTINADRPLYAKWTADACAGERKSLSKVVLTSASAGTVTGYNGDEYAGSAVIAGLSDAQVADLGDGDVTGYKMNNGGSAIVFATLKKGAFQAGDKVVIGITKKNDAYKIDSKGQPVLRVYYGTNASDATLLTTIENVSAAGYYTYRLTEADVTTIGSKKGIGLFRESSNGQNPYVYSVEITGCRSFAVTHDVTFDMKSHGTQVAKQTIEVGAKVTEPAEQEVAGYVFGGWYKETTLVNKWNFSTDVMPDNDITLYAKWTEDPCTDRQSLSKVVLTAKDNGTVTGYNSKEYAGEAIIASLDKSEDADIIGDETKERGYKLNSGGNSIVMATLKKGNFQEGDKVIVGITKVNDQRTIDASTAIMTIYAGSDKDHMMEVATIKNVNAAGFYTYRLTAANATAINEAGYKSIGLFRASSNGQNHYVYSVEITGCRDWAESHSVSYNLMGHGTPIAPQVVAKGDKVTKPTNPVETDWAFCGWYKEEGLVNEWNFASDVMGSSDIILYAKWESEAGAIKLFDGEGNLNTTNFVSPAKETIEISSVTYPCLAEFSSNRTSLGGATPTDMVLYNATTNQAKIKMTFYNSNSGVKKAILYKLEEGADAPVKIEIEVPGQEIYTTDYYEFNSSKNRSFYVCMNDRSNIRVLQVTVMDNGTTIQKAGQAGYSVTFNKGRMYVKNGVETAFEGMTINASSEYKVYNNSNLATNSYISFTNAVANTIFKVTRSSSNAYYVTNDLENKGASYTTDKEVTLTTTGTWYIGAVSSGSAASFTKFEFIAPKCEEPAFNALANSDICSGDPYVALDGTGTVSDGGSITYKWYAHGADESDPLAVLATAATYTPEADGKYYVKALHHVDGFTDNEATSSEVTVTTHAGTAITEGLANVRKTAGEASTLTVETTGKNLHYAWKECETIDGTYTDVAGATDSKSLDITVPDGIKYYKVIVSSGCGAAQESIAKVEKFVPVAQTSVSTTTVWDLTACADAQIQLTKTSSPKKGEECLMANIEGVHLDANFNSQALVMSGEYIYRDVTGKPTCAEYMKFITDVEGVVTITFSGNGSNRIIRVTDANSVQYSTVSSGTNDVHTEEFFVVPGEVELMGMNAAKTDTKQYMRFFQIEFFPYNHRRTGVIGNLGTICLNYDVPVANRKGATFYDIEGSDNSFVYFIEHTGDLEAGMPYVFQYEETNLLIQYGDEGDGSEKHNNGLYGTLNGIEAGSGAGQGDQVLQGNYMLVQNKVRLCGTGCYLTPNRAYIVRSEVPGQVAPQPASGRRRLMVGAERMNPTGVEDILINEDGAAKQMINGKLYIIRAGHIYDATGRLVK